MPVRSPDSPGVIAWPPLLYLGALGLGLALQFLLPVRPFPSALSRIVGGLLFITSGLAAKWGKNTLRRAGTNVRPDQPATLVVTHGPFRFSRNPLYLSLTGLYVGIALALDALWPLVLLAPLLLLMQWGVVLREERYLERKFGDAYRTYKARVRRWL